MKTFLEVLRKTIEYIKEEQKLAKYKATLVKMPLNFEALEYMIERAQTVEMTIQGDGFSVTLKPSQEKRKSFRDRFDEAHK